MIIHFLGELPWGLKGSRFKENDLRDFLSKRYYCGLDVEANYLTKYELDEVWYWYCVKDGEGRGYIISRKGDLYDVHDMSHCSCCGPLRHYEFGGRMSLHDIKYSLSDDYSDGISELLDKFKLGEDL